MNHLRDALRRVNVELLCASGIADRHLRPSGCEECRDLVDSITKAMEITTEALNLSERCALIGRLPCGCVVVSVVDYSESQQFLEGQESELTLAGYTVERTTVTDAARQLTTCRHRRRS